MRPIFLIFGTQSFHTEFVDHCRLYFPTKCHTISRDVRLKGTVVEMETEGSTVEMGDTKYRKIESMV
jgi:hypothetical protein